MRKSITSAAVLFGLTASVIVGASAPANAVAATNIVGNGSSFQDDFQQHCITKFNADTTATGGKTLNIVASYTKSSSGDGRTALGAGNADFAGSDSEGTATGLTASNSVYIPIAAAPVAFFFNLKNGATVISGLNLDSATLSKIFRGDITKWNDAAIKALNASVSLPNSTISVQYRQGDSGTSKNLFKFFNATSGNSSAWTTTNGIWTTGNKGTVVGTSNNGGAALVANVAATPNSIGYADLSDVTTSVKLVALKNGAGAYVKPTAAAATAYIKGTGVLTANVTYAGVYTLDWTKNIAGAYQFTILTYMIAKTSGTGYDAPHNAAVKAYAKYMIAKCSNNPAGISAPGFVTPGTTVLGVATTQANKL